MKNTSKWIAVFAIGVAAGALVGILFAPEKGEDTRKKMSKEGKKMVDAVKGSLREAKEKVKSIKKDVEKKVEEYA